MRTSVSARSRTRPASGPKTSTTGWCGRARNLSISKPFSATMTSPSPQGRHPKVVMPVPAGIAQPSAAPWSRTRSNSAAAAAVAMTMRGSSRPGNEIRRKPRPDIVSDYFRRAQLCVTQSAHAGVALFLAGNVIRDASEGRAGHHDFAGSDFGQGIGDIDAVILDIRPRGVAIDDDRRARGGHGDLQPVRGWGGVAAAGEVVKQRVANLDRDPRLVGSLRGRDLEDVDGAELVAQDRSAGRGLLAIKRLEAAAGERGDHQRGGGPDDSSMRQDSSMCQAGRRRRGSPLPRTPMGGEPGPVRALVMPPH